MTDELSFFTKFLNILLLFRIYYPDFAIALCYSWKNDSQKQVELDFAAGFD